MYINIFFEICIVFSSQQKFEKNVVGKATLGSMCTYEGSGGVVFDNVDVIGLVAIIAAHELGHNLGIINNNCKESHWRISD